MLAQCHQHYPHNCVDAFTTPTTTVFSKKRNNNDWNLLPQPLPTNWQSTRIKEQDKYKDTRGSVLYVDGATIPESQTALIRKAGEIDPALSDGVQKGNYSQVGWSNRIGTVLTPAATGVYIACRPFYWNTIDVGGRMTVIELATPQGSNERPDLLIHSPVCLDDELKDAIDKLGNVRHVVSPNYEHVKYAKMWGELYPDAYMWACPGMMDLEPDVRWSGEIPYGCRPPDFEGSGADNRPKEMWNWSEVQPFHVDAEVNPFTGKPFFNEVVFYHSKSRTLLTTDIYWNYPGDGITNSNYDSLKERLRADGVEDEDYGVWKLAPLMDRVPLRSRLWKWGMDKLFRPFYLNLMIQNKKRDDFKQIAAFISGVDSSSPSWDIEIVIPCHGDILRGKNFTKEVMRSHFKLS